MLIFLPQHLKVRVVRCTVFYDDSGLVYLATFLPPVAGTSLNFLLQSCLMSTNTLQLLPKQFRVLHTLFNHLLEPFPHLEILELRLHIVDKALVLIGGDEKVYLALFEKDRVRHQHLTPFNHPIPMHGAARCQLLYERVERESGHVCCLFVAGQVASSPRDETFSLSHLGFTNYAPFLPVGLSLSMSGLVALKVRLSCRNTLHFTIQIAFLSCGHPLCLFSQWFIGHICRHLSI